MQGQMIQVVFYRPYLIYHLQIYRNTHTPHLYHSQPLQGSLSSQGVLKASFSDSAISEIQISPSTLLPVPIAVREQGARAAREERRCPMRQQDERTALVQLYGLGQRTGKHLFNLMHVFSVLQSAHKTVQTTAEEKYLIYDLEKPLL